MKRWMWLGVGAVVFAIVLALLMSGCGRSQAPAYNEQEKAHEASIEAQSMEDVCEEAGGVQQVAINAEGYPEYVVCRDGTVRSWEAWSHE